MARLSAVVVSVAATLALRACVPGPVPVPTPVLSPVPTPVRWPSTTPSATASTPALTEGITLGGANLWMPAGATIAVHPDGSLTVTLPVGAALVGVDGADRQVVAGRVLLADGGVLTRPIATLADGDLARAPFVDGGATLVVDVPDGATAVTFDAGTRLVESAQWESDTRILVTPTRLARDLAPADPVGAVALAPRMMEEVLALHPRRTDVLDTATSINQLACHLMGARTKESWNLETDRPDKGITGFVASRCN